MYNKRLIVLFSLFLLFLHGGSVLALVKFFSVKNFLLALFMWQLLSLIGISVCYHRQITHRAFKTNRLVKIFHLFCAFLSAQAGPIVWSHVHRIHHKYSDKDKDPHSPLDGFWQGHLGWIFNQRKRANTEEFSKVPSDLSSDPDIVFFQKIHYPALVIFFFALYFIGGWELLVWQGCFRITITLHSAWIINSWGHLWGYRNYETPDHSKNSKVLAFLTAGEGFHNNHHKFPARASMSSKPFEFDLGFLYIRFLEVLGLAYEVKK